MKSIFVLFLLLMVCSTSCTFTQENEDIVKTDTTAVRDSSLLHPEVKPDSVADTLAVLKTRECKSFDVEMGTGEECVLTGTTIEAVYKDLYRAKSIDGIRFLPRQLPTESMVKVIDKDALMSVEFKWTDKNHLKVEFFYQGGSTDLVLEQVGSTVKQGIYKYSD